LYIQDFVQSVDGPARLCESGRVVRPATRLKNDADANVSQGLQDRKGRKPYRTATAQKNLAKNATTIGSRLRDIRHGSGAGTIFCRTSQGESANCMQSKNGPRGMPGSRGRQPPGRCTPLPDMSHFAAEFYECCADRTARL
jgi:hypothetical protein